MLFPEASAILVHHLLNTPTASAPASKEPRTSSGGSP